MSDYKIKVNDNRIWFGQLFGMSDHISFNLAKNGYNVAKYLPFGPVRDVMPYLIRRAEENTSVAGQTNRELSLIQTREKRRKIIILLFDIELTLRMVALISQFSTKISNVSYVIV